MAIWLAARLSREASDLPWGEAANSGMAKLLGSLPAPKARALRALCRRVVVGRPASADIRAGAGATPPELLRLFEEAFSNGLGLGFSYTDREGRKTNRRIEPHGLLVETPVWYVLARDVDKGEPRTFRMDRIARPCILPDIVFRPDPQVIQAQFPDPLAPTDRAMDGMKEGAAFRDPEANVPREPRCADGEMGRARPRVLPGAEDADQGFAHIVAGRPSGRCSDPSRDVSVPVQAASERCSACAGARP